MAAGCNPWSNGTHENDEKRDSSRCSIRDENQGQYKPETVRLEPTCSVLRRQKKVYSPKPQPWNLCWILQPVKTVRLILPTEPITWQFPRIPQSASKCMFFPHLVRRFRFKAKQNPTFSFVLRKETRVTAVPGGIQSLLSHCMQFWSCMSIVPL